ncbi:Formyltransferase/hydrolase complex Fhc subunit C [bacterium HR36]|nr:Formyltransferase/hydrolase complex Fhc subunit C [bacterium HR36]
MLQLTMYTIPSVPLEAECVRPDVLCSLSEEEVLRQKVLYGNREEKLGEFFRLSGSGESGEVHVEGELGKVKWLGARMRAGRLVIHGSPGMHLGSEMRGGAIEVFGNVGDWLGAEMRGGLIHVHGDAGHLVGAAYRGSRAGMRGGVILVEGNAGFEIGHGIRRGLIAIGGDVGDFCGVNAIAGTIVVFGRVGWRVGAGLKRGSVVLLDPTSGFSPLPTFRQNGVCELVWLRVLARQLAQWRFAPRALTAQNAGQSPAGETGQYEGSVATGDNDTRTRLLARFQGRFRRYCGDFAELPKGEILVRAL